MHDDFVTAGALAGSLQRATIGAGLTDQHVAAGERPLFDQRPTGAAAHLFVGGDQNLHAAAIRQRRHCMNGLDHAGLHVEDARARRTTFGDGEGTSCARADREDRVVMADDQHLGCAATAPVDVGAGRPIDDQRCTAQPAFHDTGKCQRAGSQTRDVERR